MKHKIYLILASFLLGYSPLLQAAKTDLFTSTSVEEPKLIVNNRILAKINGKPITTHDVMKKMDMSFYRTYPEYVSNVEARHQYYQMSWNFVLQDLIHKELVLADAQETKMTMSSGDVRQEMEQMFGPNIIVNLDKAGLTYDEAAKILQGELLIQRMLGARVHSKAVRLVTPAKVRKAYEDYIQDAKNARPTTWRYQVVTFRDRTPERAEELAKQAYQMIMGGVNLTELTDRLKEKNLIGRKAKVTISDEIQNNDQEMTEAYKNILSGMDTGMVSQPIAQKSRKENSTIYRIFYVKERVNGGFPSFKEMDAKLKEQLLNEAIDRETELYLKKLRQHYHVRENDLRDMIPRDYQPFILSQ